MPSTIDITLTNALHDTTDLETHVSNSNHNIITYSIFADTKVGPNSIKMIPLFKKADWLKYKYILHRKFNASYSSIPELNDVTSTAQIDNMIENFTKTLLEAQEASVPLVYPTPYAMNLTPDIKHFQS